MIGIQDVGEEGGGSGIPKVAPRRCKYRVGTGIKRYRNREI